MLTPFDIGTVATFSCNAGFSLNGSTAILNCTDDDQADTIGTWNGMEPSCLSKGLSFQAKLMDYFFSAAIKCPALSTPTNGQVSFIPDILTPFDIGTVATFSCNAGFSLNGSTAILNCTDDDQADTIGTWNGMEPSCLSKGLSC